MKEATFMHLATGRLHTFRLESDYGHRMELRHRISTPRTRYHSYRSGDWNRVETRRIYTGADARQFWDHFMRWMSNRKDVINLNSGQRV